MVFCLLAKEARRADALAAQEGISSFTLMQNAGRRAAQIIRRYYAPCRVHILCGPGNNGGDGFITAQHLLHHGFDARIFLLGEKENLKGDAARAASLWGGTIHPLDSDHQRADFFVDALFGTGLSRPLEARAAQLTREISAPVIALDMPSGINSDDGQKTGAAFTAERTIAFARPHPGHFLLPGKLHCGDIHIADIGIADHLIEACAPEYRLNTPPSWKLPAADWHKYRRGHVIVCAGNVEKGGAARLAARAALRIGAGLVTLNCPKEAMHIHAAHLTSIMLEASDEDSDITTSLADERRNAALIGPGYGLGQECIRNVISALGTKAHIVLDADALTVFQTQPETLFAAIKNKPSGAVVLTPHDGEYKKLFPDLADDAKPRRAQKAAERSGAIILLKGADSVIAAPDGKAVINASAPSSLATAGTGDVLAGMVAGLLAQQIMPPFDAVCAACFLHGQAAQIAGRGVAGRGLIAEDLPELIPQALSEISHND